jgi:hypothetical protein
MTASGFLSAIERLVCGALPCACSVGTPPTDASPSDAARDASVCDGHFVGSLCVPRSEICDGIDNDADARTLDGMGDARYGAACVPEEDGACGRGVHCCEGGAWTCARSLGRESEIVEVTRDLPAESVGAAQIAWDGESFPIASSVACGNDLPGDVGVMYANDMAAAEDSLGLLWSQGGADRGEGDSNTPHLYFVRVFADPDVI